MQLFKFTLWHPHCGMRAGGAWAKPGPVCAHQSPEEAELGHPSNNCGSKGTVCSLSFITDSDTVFSIRLTKHMY